MSLGCQIKSYEKSVDIKVDENQNHDCDVRR
jgi:hypothetical protein